LKPHKQNVFLLLCVSFAAMISLLLAAMLLRAAAQPYQCSPSLPNYLNWCDRPPAAPADEKK